VPPGDDRFAKLLEQELDSLEASGVLSAIRARWLEQSDWLAQLP
jgi:ABC-type amino acid transport substrate-binding protein